ncbi:MAG: DivIVA domain-containing protein [Bacteroidota bacterium]
MITPIEIRQHTFRKAFRGLDAEEVRAFLTALSKEWEQFQEEHRALKEELGAVKANYNALKEVEDMLHKTLMQAERSSRDTLETARQKADLRIQEAEAQAKAMVRRAVDDRNELQKEIEELAGRREQVLTQLQIYLKSQLDRLQDFDRVELPPTGGTTDIPGFDYVPQTKPETAPDEVKSQSNGSVKADSNLFDDILKDL